jgi:hypothetical protein
MASGRLRIEGDVMVQRRPVRVVAPVAGRPRRTLTITGLTQAVPMFGTIDTAALVARR